MIRNSFINNAPKTYFTLETNIKAPIKTPMRPIYQDSNS